MNTGSLADRMLSPQDCVLIVGLPLDKDTFLQSLQCENSYATSYVDDSSDLEWAWQIFRKRFVEPCRRETSRVEALGGTVVTHATPADVAAAVNSFTGVAIFTHSKWQPFEASQAKDPLALVESLMFGAQLSAEVFRSWFVEFEQANIHGARESFSNRVLDALATASGSSHEWWATTPAERKARDPGSLQAAVADNLCRPEIDRQFADSVYADKGIELGGRMYSPDEIFGKGGTATGQRCIFDLRICNSGLLLNTVKALHPDSLVVVNQWLANPIFGLLRYTAVLQDIRNRHCSYVSACERIHRAMADKHS